jgi:hypothetical protein
LIIFIENDNNIFGVGTFIEEFSCALLVGELHLLKRLFITLVVCANLLVWWQIHESQFPNVGFLAKQIFKILRSQTETKHVFSLASVLTTLKHFRL